MRLLPKSIQQLRDRLSSKLTGTQRAGVLGIGWSSLGQLVGLVVKLGSTLILTRLLAPEAYGILGTAMAVLTTLEWLSDLGIHPALIRHPDGDKEEFLITGWLMGVGRATLLTLCAAIASWPLAQFYDEPTLFGVLLVLSARPLLFALRSPGFPLLRRELNYKGLFFDEVAQTVVGTVCSIAMAFVFRSVWAIVLGTMAGAIVSVVLSYFLVPVRPRFKWNKPAASEIYNFGQQVFLNTLVMAAWLNLDRLLGLRVLSPAEMGLYSIAFNLSAVIESLVTRACDVYFSMLAKEKDSEAQSDWHNLICGRVASWGMPVAAIGLLGSPWVIWVLYDPRYHGAGVIFAILLSRLMIRAIGQLQFQYLLAVAEVRMATYAYLVAVVLQLAILFPMVSAFGAVGMAFSVLISTTAVTLTQTALINRKVGRAWSPFLKTTCCALLAMLLIVSMYGASPAEKMVDSPTAFVSTTQSTDNRAE